jgi:preprotein translocase subunit SecE
MGPPAGLAVRAGIGLAYAYWGTSKAHMAKVSPFKFLQEVRSEMAKVTWPSRRETAITTAMVFVMVAIASVFFLVADQIIRVAITFVLGLGG